jgi:hypothetical protein
MPLRILLLIRDRWLEGSDRLRLGQLIGDDHTVAIVEQNPPKFFFVGFGDELTVDDDPVHEYPREQSLSDS